MKNLIVSLDTYSWIKHTSGTVLKEPKSFSVMVVFSEKDRPIIGCKNLCPDAIYAQRANDLYNIGTSMGVPKLDNLMFESGKIDIDKLVMEIILRITLAGTKTIYYQKSRLLDNVFTGIKNKIENIELYSYDVKRNLYDTQIDLTEDEYKKKLDLRKYMIGIPNQSLKTNFRKYERFKKL